MDASFLLRHIPARAEITPEDLEAAVKKCGHPVPKGGTVLLCTGRPEDMELDGYLYLGLTEQRRFDQLADLQNAYRR